MADVSINGWAVSKNPDHINLKLFTIPGTTRKVKLCADAAPILLWVAARFDKWIADLDADPLAVWGYNYRKARQSDKFSDHASGTAIDLRSDKFPIGKRNMNAIQRYRVRKILKACNGLVIWGGDYKNDASADEMHFAIAPYITKQQILAWRVRNRVDQYGVQTKS